MATLLTPVNPGFPDVYQIETLDRVKGGPGGTANLQAEQLVERTAFLKKQIDDAVNGALTFEYANRLMTARTISMSGDGVWSVLFDGNGNATAAMTLSNSGVAAGTYRSVTVDDKGRVIAATNPTTLAGYGIVLPTQAQAEAGADNALPMTPLRVFQAISAKVVQATEAVLGIAKIATQALVDAGADDATIVTPKKLLWGFSISKGTNGYISLPSWLGGLIFQWGLTGVIPDDAEITVPFPIAFPNACLNVSSTCQYPALVNGGHILYIDTVSTTNFVIGADDVATTTNASLKAYWLAIGH